MRVYIIRHGLGKDNVLNSDKRVSVTHFNDIVRRMPAMRLTWRGRWQARRTAQTLARLGVAPAARLYTSPYRRTRTTARILGRHLRLAPLVVDGLAEISPRLLSAQDGPASLRSFFARAYAKLFWPFGSGETWYAGLWRARSVWRRLTRDSADTPAMVLVSHNWFISTLLLALRFNPRWRIVRRDNANGGISIVERRA